jgi:hypothetical protein
MAGTLSPAGAFSGVSYGNNVLGNVQNFLANGSIPRGAYNIKVGAPVVTATNITQVVSYNVFENVFLSPCTWDSIHSSFIGLQAFSILYNFSPTAQQLVWSGTQKKSVLLDPVNTDSQLLDVKMAVDFTTVAPELWVGYYSPSPLMTLPPTVSYAYNQVESFTTQNLTAIKYNGRFLGTLYDGADQSISTNNIQLKQIPSRVIIAVRPKLNNMTYHSTHSYFQIKKCSVMFDNNSGILSNADQSLLYNISRSNGVNLDYTSWLGEYDVGSGVGSQFNNNVHSVGSILCFDPAKDWGLSDGQACGVAGSFNFQVNLDVKCINPDFLILSSAYEIVCIVINDGEISVNLQNGTTNAKLGLITEADVLTAPLDPNAPPASELQGNGFLSGLKQFIKKAVPIARDIAPHAIEIFNKTKEHLNGSALIGSGIGAGQGHGLGRGGKLSKLSLKDRLN